MLRNWSTCPDIFLSVRSAFGTGFSIRTDGSLACSVLITEATGVSSPFGQARRITRRNSQFITNRGTNRWLVWASRR